MTSNPAPLSTDTPVPVKGDYSIVSDTKLTDGIDETEMPLPSNLQTFFLGGIFALSILAAIYVASSIFLSVALAVVLKLLLQPLVRLLDRARLPRSVGALLVILLVIGSFTGLAAVLSGPATIWAEKLPEGVPRLEAHLSFLKGPLQTLQLLNQQAAQVTDTAGQSGPMVSVRQDPGLTGMLFAGTRTVIDDLFTIVLVLYFLLVSGDIFLRRFVEILPTFSNKRKAVDISQQVEADISAYLVTITAMNIAVGLVLLSQKVAEFSCEGRCILRGFVFSMRGMRWIFERAPVKNGLGYI